MRSRSAGESGSRAEGIREQLPKGVERLWNDFDAGQHRHEVRVAVPARYDVPVQMARNARPGRATEIQADVEALGVHALFQDAHQAPERLHGLGMGRVVEVVETRLVSQRSDQQMAVVVGISI